MPVVIYLLMFDFPMVLATYLPGRIQQVIKHSMFVTGIIWAFAHLLANGSLTDISSSL